MASPSFPFANTYARLPDRFFARLDPTAVAAPSLIRINEPLARDLGLDPEALATPEGVAVLAGNRIPDGAEPLAMAYAGFQFGNWVPQLGDGRALLLGEVVAEDGERRDLQLKGSGPTPFSRRGDGRAGLGPVLREYVVSEAMHRLGVPTTRALAAVQTGEPVYREEPVPGAVLTRVARSHVRVGTFQFFAARNDEDALRTLVDWVIARHDPDLAGEERPALSLFRRVLERQAQLVAKWQGLGFIHGVMNTDNTTVSGETIDYGPCAFMDTYHPETVYSSIDHAGRYAYCNQPPIAHWNLASLAQALLPLFVAEHGGDEDAAVQAARDERVVLRQRAERVGDRHPGLEAGAIDLALRQLGEPSVDRVEGPVGRADADRDQHLIVAPRLRGVVEHLDEPRAAFGPDARGQVARHALVVAGAHERFGLGDRQHRLVGRRGVRGGGPDGQETDTATHREHEGDAGTDARARAAGTKKGSARGERTQFDLGRRRVDGQSPSSAMARRMLTRSGIPRCWRSAHARLVTRWRTNADPLHVALAPPAGARSSGPG